MENNNTFIVLLVVIGLGGLAVWLLMRQSTPTAGVAQSPGLCATAANVGIQAGGASQGVKTGDQSQAGSAICRLGEKVIDGLQLAPTAIGAIGKVFTSGPEAPPCPPGTPSPNSTHAGTTTSAVFAYGPRLSSTGQRPEFVHLAPGQTCVRVN